jgi:hypothetical protein
MEVVGGKDWERKEVDGGDVRDDWESREGFNSMDNKGMSPRCVSARW